MLRVQVLSGTSASSSSVQQLSELLAGQITTSSNDKVYHFSPNMAFSSSPSNNSHSKDVLFRVGRKETEVECTHEKSVSRQHCRLRILSSVVDDDDVNDSNDLWTTDQKKVCDATLDGIVFILQDLGSKFGTRVYYDKSHDPCDANMDSDETRDNDETDDENLPLQSRSQSNVSSAPSSLSFDTNQQTMIVLEKNGSSILHSLSLFQKDGSDHDDYSMDSERNTATCPPSRRVIVQCGMALLIITRIPMEMCTSRIPTAEKTKLTAVASSVGVVVTDQIHPHRTTHLIAPDQISSAKNISAWLLNIPVITQDYVYAMAERKNGSDPFPNVDDFKCPIIESEFQFYDPHTETSKLSIHARRKILDGYKILSMNIQPDIENMCKCAGASIVKLYKTVDGKSDMTFWQNVDFFRDLKQQQEKDQMKLVYFDVVNSRLTKIKKANAFLTQIVKESWIRLSCIPLLDGAAKAIQGVTDLVDIEGNVISRGLNNEEVTRNTIDDRSAHVNLPKKKIQILHAGINHEEMEGPIRTEQEDEAGVNHSIHDEDNSQILPKEKSSSYSSKKRKPTSQEASNQSEEKEDASQKTNDMEESHGWKSSWPNAKSKRLKSVPQVSHGWMSSNTTSDKTAKYENDHHYFEETNEPPEDDEPQEKSTKRGDTKHFKLLESNNGWFLSAPHGKDRSRLKRTVKDMHDLGEENAHEAAETVQIPLIVQSKVEIEKFYTAQKCKQITSNPNQMDFKRFVKNSVIPGKKEHAFSEIRLISVGATESRRLRELRDEEEMFDQQQQIADDLFVDGGGRRIGSDSIRHFMRPLTNNRRTLK